jgi:serine/threonine protein kinase
MATPGAHGSVFLARLDGSEEEVAVKQVLIDGLTDRDLAGAIENEIHMIKDLWHPNIVRYLGTHHCGNCLNIILEYCARGSLRQMLQSEGE